MLICPHCGVRNRTDESVCAACGKRMLVVSSGGADAGLSTAAERSVSLEEHLLERVSLLEEALRGALESQQRTLAALRRLERSALAGHAGLAAFEELLTERRAIDAEDLRRRWSRNLRESLLAMEKREVLESRRRAIQAEFAGGDPERFAALLDEATEAFAALDANGALDDLERALELDPSNPQLASLVGELDFLAGRPRRALRHFTNTLRRDPEQYEALVYSGILMHHAGEFEQADRNLHRAVELRPDEFLGWFALGALHSDMDDLRQANVYLERAVEVDRVAAALSLLGRNYRRLGKPGRAAAVLEEALELDAGDSETRYELGRSLVAAGGGREALRPLLESIETDPAGHGIGVMSTELAVTAGGDMPPALRQAMELHAQGQFGPAGRSARAVLGDAAEDATNSSTRALAVALLMESMRAEGRVREGLEAIEGLPLAEDPLAIAVAGCESAWNLAQLGEDLTRAGDLARRGLESAPESLRAHFNAALGWVHFKRREMEAARERLEKAVELRENAAHLKLLGIVVLAQGETESAEGLLERADSLTAAEPGHASWLRDRRLRGLWEGRGGSALSDGVAN